MCKNTIHRSGCFVATVSYGDEDVIEVRFLRVFRDTVLERHLVGRVFVRAYYRASPSIALVVDRSPRLKTLARRILDLLVLVAETLSTRTREDIRRSLARHSSATEMSLDQSASSKEPRQQQQPRDR